MISPIRKLSKSIPLVKGSLYHHFDRLSFNSVEKPLHTKPLCGQKSQQNPLAELLRKVKRVLEPIELKMDKKHLKSMNCKKGLEQVTSWIYDRLLAYFFLEAGTGYRFINSLTIRGIFFSLLFGLSSNLPETTPCHTSFLVSESKTSHTRVPTL